MSVVYDEEIYFTNQFHCFFHNTSFIYSSLLDCNIFFSCETEIGNTYARRLNWHKFTLVCLSRVVEFFVELEYEMFFTQMCRNYIHVCVNECDVDPYFNFVLHSDVLIFYLLEFIRYEHEKCITRNWSESTRSGVLLNCVYLD